MEYLSADEQAIWNVLEFRTDPEKPITAVEISEKTEIRERKVREIIAAMVNGGRCPLPVIGIAGAGYYVSRDPKRVEKYAKKLYVLGSKVFKRRDGILATARRCGVLQGDEEGQAELALG
jgi:hypothetical protein